MAEKELILTLRLKVTDLPDHRRKELARDMAMEDEDEDGEANELPGLDDVEPMEVGQLVAMAIASDEADDLIFEGSDHFVMIAKAAVQSADWADAATSS